LTLAVFVVGLVLGAFFGFARGVEACMPAGWKERRRPSFVLDLGELDAAKRSRTPRGLP
jgi:hypothetical protein